MFKTKGNLKAALGVWCLLLVIVAGVFAMPAGTEAAEQETTIIGLEGADAKSEKVLEEMEEAQSVILFANETASSGLKTAAATDKVVLSYSRKIYYEDFFTRNYRVKYDGETKIAYCVQPKELPPSEGTWTAKEYNNKLMTKALYYAYGYPGFDKKTRAYLSKKDIDDDYEDDDGAYALSHLVLSYFYDKQSINSDAFLGVSSDTKKLIKKVADKIENDWPDVPDDSSLSLNRKTATAVWNQEGQYQQTPVFKLTGHSDNRILVTVPSYATMVKTSDGVTKKYYRGEDNSKRVKVYGGDTFYFTAPASVQGTFQSPEMKGVLTDFQPYIISVTGKQNIVFCGVGEKDSVSFSINWASLGSFVLNKTSANVTITKNNSCYSLKGAKYGIYDSSGSLVATVITDENGKVETVLPYGSYTVKELSASEGYAVDTAKHTITVKKGGTTLNVKEVPKTDLVDLMLQKKDKETADATGQSAATLEGAHYQICYYDGYHTDETDFSSLRPERSWIVRTDEEGRACLSEKYRVSGDDFYANSNKAIVLPIGTVTVKEVKAPEGYVLDEQLHVVQIKGNGTSETVDMYQVWEHEEQIIRGDFSFLKKAGGEDGEALAGIPFTITAESTGETKTVKTDKNGSFSTKNSDIWFGDETCRQEGLGALAYDTYTIREQRCSKNVGLQLLEPFQVTIDENEQVKDLGILVDEKILIHTVAMDPETKKKYIMAETDAKIQDSILYDGLEAGASYTVKGTLMDGETGKPLIVDGKELTTSTDFTTENKKGVVTVDFQLDASQLGGRTIVVYESLYKEENLEAEHTDLYSEEQTVRVHVVESPPEDKTPETGDEHSMSWVVAVLAAAGVLMAVLVLMRHRKKSSGCFKK